MSAPSDFQFADLDEARVKALTKAVATPEGRRPVTVADMQFVLATIGQDTRALLEHKILALERRIAELEQRPVPEYKGVWNESTVYGVGSMVTHGGSVWYAKGASVSRRPGTDPTCWMLAVKRGADGKDAR